MGQDLRDAWAGVPEQNQIQKSMQVFGLGLVTSVEIFNECYGES